ncbi:MAG TPA: ferritin-like domain-containing protein [Oleiagrimonas sp.]|nr:ferritin-like domain-containing protein [Oleiagrimonas sp.]
MSESSMTLHEPGELLSAQTIESHRGFVSLMEELEAVDWYNQRVDASNDEQLKAILAHNRDEEKEHAMMVLEWLRRHDPVLDKEMRTYLFTEGDILAAEDAADTDDEDDTHDGTLPVGHGSLNIGSLKEARS